MEPSQRGNGLPGDRGQLPELEAQGHCLQEAMPQGQEGNCLVVEEQHAPRRKD